jgi:tetratricopeptide (TPR) repeat protein
MLAGEAQDALRNTPAAVEEFRAAVAADPKYLNVRFALGYLYFKLHRNEEAWTELEAELVNDPQSAFAPLYPGDVAIQEDRWKDAANLLPRGTPLNPAMRIAQYDLGLLGLNQGGSKDAEASFRHAIAIDSEVVEAHDPLARLLASMGRRDEARSELDKAKAIHRKEGVVPLVK